MPSSTDGENSLVRLARDLDTRGDGRTVYGVAIPFDREAKVDDGLGPYVEVIRRGAFAKTLREQTRPFKLCVNHDKLRNLPIGRAEVLREDAGGLYGEFRVSQTQAGDDALTLIRDGVVDAFSCGMIPVKDRETKPGLVERTELKLTEVSVVAFPAYAEALIAGVRHGADPAEIQRLRELVRTHPGLLEQLAEEIEEDTPTEGAAQAVPDDGSEPAEATRDDEPPVPEHSSDPTPTPPDRLRRELDHIRARRQALLTRSERYL